MRSGTTFEMPSRFLNLLFGCRHRQISRVFTIHGSSYKVCVECGTRFEYSLDTMSVVRRVPHLSATPSYRSDGQARGIIEKMKDVFGAQKLMPGLLRNGGGKLR